MAPKVCPLRTSLIRKWHAIGWRGRGQQTAKQIAKTQLIFSRPTGKFVASCELLAPASPTSLQPRKPFPTANVSCAGANAARMTSWNEAGQSQTRRERKLKGHRGLGTGVKLAHVKRNDLVCVLDIRKVRDGHRHWRVAQRRCQLEASAGGMNATKAKTREREKKPWTSLNEKVETHKNKSDGHPWQNVVNAVNNKQQKGTDDNETRANELFLVFVVVPFPSVLPRTKSNPLVIGQLHFVMAVRNKRCDSWSDLHLNAPIWIITNDKEKVGAIRFVSDANEYLTSFLMSRKCSQRQPSDEIKKKREGRGQFQKRKRIPAVSSSFFFVKLSVWGFSFFLPA